VELVNEFRVPVPADRAWEVLTDIERIAPCLPGAQLLSVDGEEFTGAVKVKVGPITMQYKGKAAFQQKDESVRRAVIKASGKETRGQGNAAAVVTADLKENGAGTTCFLTTDLTISGKAAQFGRGILADVATKLIDQFADRLAADVLADSVPAAAADAAVGRPAPQRQAAESMNLAGVLAVPLAKRALPLLAGLIAGIVLGWLLGRRSG
jgi:carbon monoxide dehydrogenase subunit G